MDPIDGELADHYEQLTFSGGGLRCFWQGGALDELRRVREVAPRRVSAASGGALSAATVIAGCGEQLIETFCRHLESQESNVELEASADVTNLTPHQHIYDAVVREVLSESACEAVAHGPRFDVLLCRPPRFLPKKLAALLTLVLYEADKLIRSSPHGRFAKWAGARPVRADARQAARDGLLPDLVCLAATIPPVFEIRDWQGVPVIDAGAIDNAPPPEPDEGRTLVLLTRSYRNLPDRERRTYLVPSEATPADKIDFTDAEALKRTYEQGRRDMRRFVASRANR
jgi:predicted acylesterase/phospholipase RssA